MSFLGIDLGTTGCKAVLFDEKGGALASAYREYTIISEQPGQAELDPWMVWDQVKGMIKDCVSGIRQPIEAISVSSLGEAVVPVSLTRKPLGNSLLSFDIRGNEFVPQLRELITDQELYRRNGNPLGTNYSLTKLMWYRENQPELYRQSDSFLLWASYILFMLGAAPVVDYAHANRTLAFDIDKKAWNAELLGKIDFDPEKLPELMPAGSVCGSMTNELSAEFGLHNKPLLVVGTHDQCANALGCGVLDEGTAMYGMGTYHCIVSVYNKRKPIDAMLARGLNTEHHAVPERWVSFIYNQGGILLKWFRDTFVQGMGMGVKDFPEGNIYEHLMHEMPIGPSPVTVLPHFITTGPPDFLEKTSGNISGLTIDTTRGDICKGVLEGTAFYLKENLDNLPEGMKINQFRVVGGGSRSDIWVQLTADILELPCTRTREPEAGALGAAILAAVGSGKYQSFQDAADAMVSTADTFYPDPDRWNEYSRNYERYKQVLPLMGSFLASYK